MKRIFSIAGLVVFVVVIAYFVFSLTNKKTIIKEDGAGKEDVLDTLKELTLSEKPYFTISPGPSCEYTLSISNIKNNPSKIEYELVYKNEDGVTQGASGTITPNTATTGTKKILFGTESSGHRKCDKGVEGGSITIRYRNDEGKLTSKLSGQFAVFEGGKELVMSDKFSLILAVKSKEKFVISDTFGVPETIETNLVSGPVGVFTSGKSKNLVGIITMPGEGNLQAHDGRTWKTLEAGKINALGTFVKTK